MTFADGTHERIDLIYGENVCAYNDMSAAPRTPVIWDGTTPAGDPVALRALIWTLANKNKTIRRLSLRSADAPPSLMVLGVTALDAD